MNDPTATVANPAAGIDPASLDELMSRDPLELSKQDLEVIVTQLRRMREVFAKELAAQPAPASRGRTPKPKTTLEDLGL